MGASLLECILSSLCLLVLIIESARISTEDSECCQYIALDSDDLLYLKEQMEAEEDAERLRRRTEKRAFAAFKISFTTHYLYFGRLLFIFLSCDVTF